MATEAGYLPAELATHTVESLRAMHGGERPWIYWLLVGATMAGLASLPLIRVEVGVRAAGIVRPAMERTELKFATSGRIARVLARGNDHVAAGKPLVELVTGDLDERVDRNRALQAEHAALIADLVFLTASFSGDSRPVELPLSGVTIDERRASALLWEGDPDASPAGERAVGNPLRTGVMRREAARYRVQHASARLAEAKARNELERYRLLGDKGIATRQELDNAQYAATQAAAELTLLERQTSATWETRLREERTTLDQLISEARRLTEERQAATMRAPATGTVQGLQGLAEGSWVVAGQSLGWISPDDDLVVEAYLSPADIGQVRVGQTARLQIDAYPYTEWGLLDAEVLAVAADAAAAENRTVFKVLMRPRQQALQLANGARGVLRKGLTLTARLVVARRSLAQLLYENASDWADPQGSPHT